MSRGPTPGAICAIETSTRTGSVAVWGKHGPLEERLEENKAHASDLLPALERLRSRVCDPALPLETVIVGTGPGSYTGLRVGIATALGLARGFGASLHAVASFEALALGELSPGEEGCVFWNARGGAYYLARYLRSEDDVEVLEAPCALPLAAALGRVPEQGVLFCDASTREELNAARPPGAQRRLESLPRAGALLQLGWKRFAQEGPHAPETIAPLYLREFAAAAGKRR